MSNTQAGLKKPKSKTLEYQREYRKKYFSDKGRHNKYLQYWKDYNQTPRRKYDFYFYSARQRGLSFEITFIQFLNFWQNDCFYCKSRINTVGLDRIDNSKGYILSNLVSCCEICNKAKATLTHYEFLTHIRKILNNYQNPIIKAIERIKNLILPDTIDKFIKHA